MLVASSLLLPLLFLVPLPAALWSGLPGRALVSQSFELAGGKGWSSASVEPIRTLLALTALITPLALLAIGWSMKRDRLILVGWMVVALGLVNLAIGVVQVLSNGETGLFYPENPMPGVLFGTFANRNTAGVFLVGVLAMATFLPAPARIGQAELPIRILICVLLLVAILLTRSRTAIVLSLLPLGAALLRVALVWLGGDSKVPARVPGGKWAPLAALALVAAMLGSVVVIAPGRIGDAIERFESGDPDARTYIWEDAAYAADRYWPLGAGMGTFDDVFQIDESLEHLTVRRAGRAHNDYLEVAIEAGLPGLVLVAAWLSLLVWLSWRARSSPHRWIAWSGALALVVIAAQSVTDYPLRNQTMLAFGAFALLVLARFGEPERGARL